PPIERQTLALAAPIDTPAFVYGWPLPAEHVARTRLRALASILADHIDGEVRGAVRVREYGGDRAPMVALVIVPAADESLTDARAAIERAIDELPTSFDNQKFYDDSFDHAQRSELARLLAILEDGGGRDAHVAAHALAGRDPARAVTDELRALASLDRDATSKLARTVLRREAASIVTLRPESAGRTGRPVEIDPALHGTGIRRVLDDPADAERPAAAPARPALPAILARQLATGIRVVLLPAPAAPTVDVRVVFAVGTGDEPSRARGVALLAAHALAHELVDVADVIRFYEAGGKLERRVDLDHTTFKARGLARDLDLLLMTLERLLRNGHYPAASRYADLMRTLGFARDPDAATDAAWRRARYGPDHPYVAAGILRDADVHALDARAAEAFRVRHYRPDAMTIIIAGGFDPALANAWIDFQFATWSSDGPRPPRHASPARLEPAALAAYEDTTMVQLQIALPVAGPREHGLLVSELIDQTIADVRHQLGAAYALSAWAETARLASAIRSAGHIDASRAADAVRLVHDRLAALRTADRDTASRFVAARRRVAARLQSLETSSAALATLAERETAARRKVGADLELADRVRKLTLRDLAPALGSLELSRAALLMRGPESSVKEAYEAIGRTPRTIP
ncbi:MAG TPA: insulinase family protein, partial [Kofleriaceae bacterium]|nr:insulinase family protein [Kofleriaceae bacterium]